MRRMDRYREQDSVRTSRTDKNQELYRNVSNNTVYTNITDVVNANAFEINNQVEKKNRVLVTTLTKKMAEDLTSYYEKLGMKIQCLTLWDFLFIMNQLKLQ